jgi:nicotinamidase/pyrazinamidase
MTQPLTVNPDHSVLLLVDVQPDFMPGGALPAPRGDEILGPIRTLMTSGLFRHFVATQDWHPPGHVSFASSHSGRKPFDTIELYGHEQTLWPDHCVQNSEGAALHPDLPWEKLSCVIRKGMDPKVDSYSGFRNNWDPQGHRPATGLAGYLRDRGINDIYLCGLARDVCVKWTAEDAAAEEFRVRLLWDLTRPVEESVDDAVRKDLERKGVHIITSERLTPERR